MQTGFDESDDPRAEPPSRYLLSPEEWSLALNRFPRLGLEQLGMASEGVTPFTLQTQPTASFHGNVAAFMAEARTRLSGGEHLIVSAGSTGELERFADICHEYELPYRVGELEENATVTRLAQEESGAHAPAMVLVKAPLGEGVVFPEAQLALYGTADLFETLPPPDRPRSRPKTASFFSDFSDLKPGDFVVHVDHGIGMFDGLRQVAVEGASGEFMLLRYADDARLYVPLSRLDLVQKYQSLGGVTPTLDRLGSAVWEARKTRVRKSVSDMSGQLLALYSERKTLPGHAFPVDSNFQREFEDAFEFQETPDQQKAIDDVKRDMEASLPMDRLLCGDVGYGKTEVAMRAAFKALSDSKQVAVLAPTTVLAFQHYQTFRRRFAAFPVRIEMLSRFRSEKEQKKTLEELEAGKVDVVIGTHRLLSKDVKFHDLGLLVVDEEQRFGVAHKERLKEMRKNVDVLTMSATPIPRTLHMSLVGLRDMSLIETPPKDRLAIQTTVSPFSEALVQRVVEEELARKGQVFFVHNRVESIDSLAAMLHRLVPRARIVVGHGKMRETELEKVMLKFVRDEADVLVSTTIIENGLDIPRANTILINRADRMGLSELYQLRGRVGRSNQRAYAYLLIPPDTTLTTIARQRLAALKEFSDLGAGFRIAALDLELRGAGNLLGGEQHGHIEAVGFDMYCQMMERAVAERKGEAVAPERRVTLNLGQDVRIPPEYIESENLRLRIYKRIAGVATDAEKEEVRRELDDRFGPPPPAVANLLDYAVLKAVAEKLLVASVERRGDQIAIKFHEDTPLGPERLVKLIRKRRDLRFDPNGVLWLALKGGPTAGGGAGARAASWRPSETYCYNYKRRDRIFNRETLMKKTPFLLGALLLPCAYLLLVAAPNAAAQEKPVVVEDIIARVNNSIITMSDYQKSLQEMAGEVRQDCPSCTPDRLTAQLQDRQKNLLRDMIDQQLLIERAKDMDVSVETDVIKRLDEVRKQNNLASLEDLQKAVESQGIVWEDYKTQLRNSLLTQEVIRREVGSRMNIGSDEIKKYYEAHKKEFNRPEQVALAEIMSKHRWEEPGRYFRHTHQGRRSAQSHREGR